MKQLFLFTFLIQFQFAYTQNENHCKEKFKELLSLSNLDSIPISVLKRSIALKDEIENTACQTTFFDGNETIHIAKLQ